MGETPCRVPLSPLETNSPRLGMEGKKQLPRPTSVERGALQEQGKKDRKIPTPMKTPELSSPTGDIFSSPFIEAQMAKGSRIPRPDGEYSNKSSHPKVASRLSKVGSGQIDFFKEKSIDENSVDENRKTSKIPVPKSIVKKIQDSPSPSGFYSYINPSFEGGYEEHQKPSTKKPVPCLPMPQALRLLQQVSSPRCSEEDVDFKIESASSCDSECIESSMQAIADAYIRTGPMKLSPEPQKEYCIEAPKPLQDAVAINKNKRNIHANKSSQNSDPIENTGCRIANQDGSAEISKTQNDASGMKIHSNDRPLSKDQNIKTKNTGIPKPKEVEKPCHPSSLGRTICKPTPTSVCSNMPEPVVDASNLSPLCKPLDTSPGMQNEKKSIQDPARIETVSDFVANANSTTNQQEARCEAGKNQKRQNDKLPQAVCDDNNTHSQSTMDRNDVSLTQNDEGGTIVTFDVKQSCKERVQPDIPLKEHGREIDNQEKSFSFGMGIGNDDTVSDAAKNVENQGPEILIDQDDLEEAGGSDDSVDQPNLFVSFLNDLVDGGTKTYISPAQKTRNRLLAKCSSNGEGISSNSVGKIKSTLISDSPRSPEDCTPLRLISEGTETWTPELGEGDFASWIEHRGMRQILNTQAEEDLRRMWIAIRENAKINAAVQAAQEENINLRQELESMKRSFEKLKHEKQATVRNAEAGKEWAEDEVSRTREAASQMMALADQIQATFSLCEKEKCMMLEELQKARKRAEEAENAFASADRGDFEKEVAAVYAAARKAEEEAHAAKIASEASEQELIIIKKQLKNAQDQLNQLASFKWSGKDKSVEKNLNNGNYSSPLPALQESLRTAHKNLSTLHENVVGSQDTQKTTNIGETCVSPAVSRLLASSSDRLAVAEDLLDKCPNDRQVAICRNDNSLAMELQYSDTCYKLEEQMAMEPLPEENEPGTLSVDFQELQKALAEVDTDLSFLEYADPYVSPSAETSPKAKIFKAESEINVSNLKKCNVEVEDIIVTNVPQECKSQVKSMVSYFEALAEERTCAEKTDTNDDIGCQDHAFFHDSINTCAADDEKDLDIQCLKIDQDDTSNELTEVPIAEETSEAINRNFDETETYPVAIVSPGDECNNNQNPYALVSLDDNCVCSFQSSRSWIDNSGVNVDKEFVAETPVTIKPQSVSSSDDEEVPSTPACTPADGLTPYKQQQHLKAIEALKNYNFDDNSMTPKTSTPEFVSSEDVALVHQTPMALIRWDGSSSPQSLLEDRKSSTPEREITPFDLGHIRNCHNGDGISLKDQVRARLNKLKTELNEARSKLNRVDLGLAAIATPTGHRAKPALPAPDSAKASSPAVFKETNEGDKSHSLICSISTNESSMGEQNKFLDNRKDCQVQLRSAMKGARKSFKEERSKPSVRFAVSSVEKSLDSPKNDFSEVSIEYHKFAKNLPLDRSGNPSSRCSNVLVNNHQQATSNIAETQEKSEYNRTNVSRQIYPVDADTIFRNLGTCTDEQLDPLEMRERDEASSFASNIYLASNGLQDSDTDDDDWVITTPISERNASLSNNIPLSRIGMNTGYYSHSPMSGSRAHQTFASSVNKPSRHSVHENQAKVSPLFLSTSNLSSVMSTSPSPRHGSNGDLLSIRPVVISGMRRSNLGHNQPGNNSSRRPSEVEEREFRRRAAALNINVSPYFKKVTTVESDIHQL